MKAGAHPALTSLLKLNNMPEENKQEEQGCTPAGHNFIAATNEQDIKIFCTKCGAIRD